MFCPETDDETGDETDDEQEITHIKLARQSPYLLKLIRIQVWFSSSVLGQSIGETAPGKKNQNIQKQNILLAQGKLHN